MSNTALFWELNQHFHLHHNGSEEIQYSYISIDRCIHEENAYRLTNKFGPRQSNLVLIAYASSEGSGEPAHPRSLARTSATRSYKQ